MPRSASGSPSLPKWRNLWSKTFSHSSGRPRRRPRNEKATPAARVAAARLLGFGPFNEVGEPLAELLNPRSPVELQSTALRALAGFNDPKVGPLMLGQWDGYGPTLRREATEALFARPDRLKTLLDAVEAKKVSPAHIEAARVEALRKHSDMAIRNRASQLFVSQLAPDRKKVLDDYRPALELKGDLVKGRELFRKNCTACHRLENTGTEVGASLIAALQEQVEGSAPHRHPRPEPRSRPAIRQLPGPHDVRPNRQRPARGRDADQHHTSPRRQGRGHDPPVTDR